MRDYQFVRYSRRHRRGVIALYRHLLGPHEDFNEGYLRWKYEDHPEAEEPQLLLGLYRGDVVGMRGFMPQTWEVGTPPRAVPLWYAGDLVVHPAHRSRGLMPYIMRAAHTMLAEQGRDWTINASGVRYTHQMSRRVGWRSVGPREVVRREGSAPFLTRSLGRVARRLGVPAPPIGPGPLSGIDRNAARLGSMGLTVERRPRPAAMAKLVARIPPTAPFRLRRDETFFGWRFLNPRSDYRFLYLEEGGALRGYAVAHAHARTPQSPVSLVGWEAGTPEDLRTLLSAVTTSLRRPVESWALGRTPAERGLLAEHGFEAHVRKEGSERDRPDHLILRALGSAESRPWAVDGHSLLDPATWELRPLCSDAF